MTIGITGPDDVGEYARAVREAGAEPLKLKNDRARIPAYLAACHGIIFSGGYDVAPECGGAAFRGETYVPERDAFELALARQLRSRTIPTLGICKGLQLLNVAFGGALVPDIAATHPSIARDVHQPKHASGRKNRDVIVSHVVTLAPGTLATAIGREVFATTSRHHQAIDERRLSPDFRVAGRTEDGIIEAVEATFAHPWFAAVQWHPETSAVQQDDGPEPSAVRRIRRRMRAPQRICVIGGVLSVAGRGRTVLSPKLRTP